MFVPKLFTTLKTYTREQFTADLVSGTIVGIVALPLAIAFAIASGVTPDKGLITAIIAGFIISFLGGSKVQIGGPTGAFVVIVYGIIAKHGIEGLLISTIMAGIILIIMGFAKIGSIIKFVPYPIVVGFTSGIAVIIFSSQINDLLGLNISSLPAEFIDKWSEYFIHFHQINIPTVLIGLSSLAFISLWSKMNFKVPGSIIAILATTMVVFFFELPVETIQSKFGEIPSTIPAPQLGNITYETVKSLVPAAITIALLGAIESLLACVVADGMTGGRHRSNMELVAQGVANIGSALFGGIPATGAIARTMTNIKSGGKTPVAGIVHALVLLAIMLIFGSYAGYIPLATLSAILIFVSYNMFDKREFKNIRKSPRSDSAVMLTTFVLTVLFDLTLALQVGMFLAVLLFMRRMATVTNVGVITRELSDRDEEADEFALDKKVIPYGVDIYEINGPFFFGAAGKFRETLDKRAVPPKICILRMRNVPAIDQTGLHFLEEFLEKTKKLKIDVIFSGVHAQPFRAIEQYGMLEMIPEENICGNIDIALERAEFLLNAEANEATQ